MSVEATAAGGWLRRGQEQQRPQQIIQLELVLPRGTFARPWTRLEHKGSVSSLFSFRSHFYFFPAVLQECVIDFNSSRDPVPPQPTHSASPSPPPPPPFSLPARSSSATRRASSALGTR